MPSKSDQPPPLEKRPRKRGRPPLLNGKQQEQLRDYVEAHPEATVKELAKGFSEQVGVKLPASSLYNYFQRMRISYQTTRQSIAKSKATASESESEQTPPVSVRYSQGPQPPEPSGRKAYPSDLTDDEWAFLKSFIEKKDPRGRPRSVDLREVVNAIRYMSRTGCQWRYLPHDFPRWDVVAKYFYRWREQGVWDELNKAATSYARVKEGRNQEPSAGIIDSQSVKTTEVPSERGFDGAKKLKGRKRHILVDVLGLLLVLVVHSAGIQDRHGASQLLNMQTTKQFPELKKVWADQGYSGKIVEDIRTESGLELTVIKRSRGKWAARAGTVQEAQEAQESEKPFAILPRRWVVERTFGWLGRYRRLSKDYEASITSSRAWILVSMTTTVLRRWVKPG